jgi:uncharacterized repeat protein (TIGR01451 family)
MQTMNRARVLLLGCMLVACISLPAFAQIPPPVEVPFFTKVDSPDPVLPGAVLTYTITGLPEAEDATYGVMLTDAIPASTTFLDLDSPSDEWTVTIDMGIVTATNPAYIPDGIADSFILKVTVDADAPSGLLITNTAVVLAQNLAEEDDVVHIFATTTTAVAITGLVEPSALVLMGIGLAGLGFSRRKRAVS